MSPPLIRLFVALLFFSLMGGCTVSKESTTSQTQDPQENPGSPTRLKVIATVLPTYLFTQAVAGDAAEVDILIAPGTEAHDYQSAPNDVQAIAQADVVVENGLGLEAFLDSTIASAENPDLIVIDASQGIEALGELSPVIYSTQAGEIEQEGGHTHAENPHVWLDPTLAIQQVETIRDGLIAADPRHESTYETNAAAYIEQLQALDRQFQEQLKSFGDRSFITFHDAFPYLAKRYNLQQVAIVAIPEDNLTPNDIQKTIEIVKELEVKVLFGEPGVDNKLLQSLSQDLNIELGTLDSLESGDRDPQYYFTVMEQNLKTLAAAFK